MFFGISMLRNYKFKRFVFKSKNVYKYKDIREMRVKTLLRLIVIFYFDRRFITFPVFD